MHTEQELLALYGRHRALHEAGDWVGLGDLFAEQSSYLDSVYGWSHGRDAIRAFLADSMRGLDEWTFPISAVAADVGTSTVLNHWHNRLPGTRPDGGHYEVPGASVITFGPDGLITRQMDLFDTAWIMREIEQWTNDHDGRVPYPTD